MSKNRSRVSKALLPAVVAAAAFIGAPGASAQSSTVIRPPKVSEPSAGQTWLYYLTGLGLGAIAVGITIMPSRRTHQD